MISIQMGKEEFMQDKNYVNIKKIIIEFGFFAT